MTDLLDLYQCAEESSIDVDWFPMSRASSLSAPLPDGSCSVAIDPWKMETIAQETVCLAHELGHCNTGSFYNRWAARDVRQKHENRADKWAIKKLVPKDELDEAVSNGYTDLWSLANYFNVTVDFMKKAVCFYTYGNLSTDLYF